MNKLLGNSKISFRDLERSVMKLVIQVHIEAMEQVLRAMDQQLFEERDAERYESLGFVARTVDTIFGVPVTFKRRYYKDREAGGNVFLLDEVLGLPSRARHSPLAREIAVAMAVDGPSYRLAAESLERIFGSRVISHEGIRQNVFKASKAAEAHVRSDPTCGRLKREPGILFIEADGLYVSLQRQLKRRGLEEKVAIAHEGWVPRPTCMKEFMLRRPMFFMAQSSSGEEFWSDVSEGLYDYYEIGKDTVIVINGDRAPWIRIGRERFGDANVLYQIDRFHLLRSLREIFGHKSSSYRRLCGLVDQDPTGCTFMGALAEETSKLEGKKHEKAEALIKDLMDIPEATCDYRVRLANMGYDVSGLRGMGAAESQMDRFADRVKRCGLSWSPEGLDAMMRLLGKKFEGRLEEILQTMAMEADPLPKEKQWIKRQSTKVSRTITERYGDVWSHRVPVTDAGRSASWGRSNLFNRIAGGF